MKTCLKVHGSLFLKVTKPDGVSRELHVHNAVVSGGLVRLATVIAGGSFGSALSHIALGNSNTAVTLADTALGSEVRRDAATVAQLASPDNNKVQFTKTFAAGAISGTFKEAGIFDAASSGNMFNRTVFSDFVVGVLDTFSVTWLIEIRGA